MTNRITLLATALDTAKVRSFEFRDTTIEIVSLWVEVRDDDRADRFTVEIGCPKAAEVAKALPKGARVEVTGKLRHDRWKDKASGRWTGKVFISVEPGAGTIRSKGIATAEATEREAA
ncbi:MAG: single-stranded DNA-binding protein [Hyphomonadaceae bacterium]|nr:single-stranded DNA-binding protein [Hyphomonadaceae bacterium]